MVDLAINDLASTSSDLSANTLSSDDSSTLLFKDPSEYHPLCGIDWGNHTSEMDWYVHLSALSNATYDWSPNSWLATSGVYLMDLDQSNSDVSNTLTSWVAGYVSEYSIDGFRLDASKHMPIAWQSGFCKTAGIFCMGEVAGDDTAYGLTLLQKILG